MIYCDTSKLPERRSLDVYETPRDAADAILTWHDRTRRIAPRTVLDLGAGRGVYGQAAKALWPGCHVTGLEIRDLAPAAGYDRWLTGDLLEWEPDGPYDLILGNPPYYCAERAVWRALEALADHGTAIMLLRLAFLAGQRRAKTLYAQHLLHTVVVCSKRISFNTDGSRGTGPTDHAHFIFRKGNQRPPRVEFLL